MLHHVNGSNCPLCEEKLSLAHAELRSWFIDVVKPWYLNAHISWSFREKTDQEVLFLNGKTKLHFPESAHNKSPALALDLFQIDPDGEGFWNPEFFAALHAINVVKHPNIFWGGLWRSLGDKDHFELTLTQPAT